MQIKFIHVDSVFQSVQQFIKIVCSLHIAGKSLDHKFNKPRRFFSILIFLIIIIVKMITHKKLVANLQKLIDEEAVGQDNFHISKYRERILKPFLLLLICCLF